MYSTFVLCQQSLETYQVDVLQISRFAPEIFRKNLLWPSHSNQDSGSLQIIPFLENQHEKPALGMVGYSYPSYPIIFDDYPTLIHTSYL